MTATVTTTAITSPFGSLPGRASVVTSKGTRVVLVDNSGGAALWSSLDGLTWANAGSCNFAECIVIDDSDTIYAVSYIGDEIYCQVGHPNASLTLWTFDAAVKILGRPTPYIGYRFPRAVVHRSGSGWILHVAAQQLQDTGGDIGYDMSSVVWVACSVTSGHVVTGSAATVVSPSWSSVNNIDALGIDFVHTGDGITPAAFPDIGIAWTAQSVAYFERLPATATSSWTVGTARALSQNGAVVSCRWDGSRWLLAGTASGSVLWTRDRADTVTTSYRPPGSMGDMQVGYDDEHAYLFFADFTDQTVQWTGLDWSTGVWTSPATIASGIGTSTQLSLCVPPKRVAVAYVAGSASPYSVEWAEPVDTNRAPMQPTWQVVDGPADINAPLDLPYSFNDPDLGDTQLARALSRIVGTGAEEFWDGSAWQSTIQWVTTADTAPQLSAGWGAVGESHAYYVQTKDAAGLASPKSAALHRTASAKVDPVITSGTTTDTASYTVTFTCTDMSAQRVTGNGQDTGWVDTTTPQPVTITGLANGQTATVTVQTRNSAGLASDVESVQVTATYTRPAAPVVAATPDPANGRIVVGIVNPVNLLANGQIDDLTSWAGLGPNLLSAAASSFEDGATGGWLNGGNALLANTTVQALDGTHALQITASAAGDAGVYAPGTGNFTVVPGVLYQAVASLRAAATPRAFVVQIYWYDSTGTQIGLPTPGSTFSDTTTGWRQGTVQAVAPATAAYGAVRVTVMGCAAAEQHYLDCAGVFQTPLIPGAGQQILDNGDFEIDANGWSSANGATVAVDSSQAYVGRQALRVTFPTFASQVGALVAANLAATTTYTMSAWVYVPASGGVSNVWLQAYGAGMAAAVSNNPGVAPTHSWQRISLTFTTGPGGSVNIFFGANNPTSGQVLYLDAVKLELGSVATPFVPNRYANLVPNPSAEVDLTGWTGGVRDTTRAFAGSASVKMVRAGGVAGNAWPSAPIPVAAGDTYTGSFWVWLDDTIGSLSGNLYFSRADGNLATGGDTVHIRADDTKRNQWQRVVTTQVVPADATHVVMRAFADTGADGTAWVDAFQTVQGHDPLPYVDGSLGSGLAWESAGSSVTNPAFGTDTAGWSFNAAGSNLGVVTRVTSGGPAAGPVTYGSFTKAADGATPTTYLYVNGSVIGGNRWPAGTVVTMSFWARYGAGQANVGAATVKFADGTALNISSPVEVFTPTTFWQRFSFTFALTADMLASNLVYIMLPGSMSGSFEFHLTGLQIEQRDHATPYGATGAATASTSAVQPPWGVTGQTTLTRLPAPPGTPVDSWQDTGRINPPAIPNPNLLVVGAAQQLTLQQLTTYSVSAYCGRIAVLAVPTASGPRMLAISDPADDSGRATLIFTTGAGENYQTWVCFLKPVGDGAGEWASGPHPIYNQEAMLLAPMLSQTTGPIDFVPSGLPAVVSNSVYVTRGSNAEQGPVATLDPDQGWSDWTPASGQQTTYRVEALTASGVASGTST